MIGLLFSRCPVSERCRLLISQRQSSFVVRLTVLSRQHIDNRIQLQTAFVVSLDLVYW